MPDEFGAVLKKKTATPDEFGAVPKVQAADEFGAIPKVATKPAPPQKPIATPDERPLISGENRFLKMLDAINTPQQMLFGVMTKGENESFSDAAKRGARDNLSALDVLIEGKEGIFKKAERERRDPYALEIAASTVLSTVGDLAFDPLNFVPFGKVFRPVKRVVGAVAAKGFERLPQGAQQVVKGAAQKVSKYAFRSPAEREAMDVLDRGVVEYSNAEMKILDETADFDKLVRQAAKESGRSLEESRATITAVMERKSASPQLTLFDTTKEAVLKTVRKARQSSLPFENKLEITDQARLIDESVESAAPKLTPQEQSAVLKGKQLAEDQFAREVVAGLNTQQLADAELDYVTHLMTREARAAAQRLPEFRAGGFRRFRPAHAFQIARRLRGMSISEVNELAAKGELPGFEGVVISKFFHNDPAAVLAVRNLRGAKAIADTHTLYNAASLMGRTVDTAPNGWVKLALTKTTDERLLPVAERFKDILFDPDVAHHLNEFMEASMSPKGLNDFLRVYDQVTGIWRGITLSIFPSFHLRNEASNVWSNYIAGMRVGDSHWYKKAALLQTSTDGEIIIAGRSRDAGVLRTLISELGVAGRGFFSGEVPSGFREAMGTGVGPEDIPVFGKAVRFGFRQGAKLEDNARIAHFLWRLNEGDDNMKALHSVHKYLFDYKTGLTDFERSFLRRIMPFYSWTRFNIPLQASALIDNPRPFIRLAEVVRTARLDEPKINDEEFHKKVLPDFIRESSGVPIRIAPDGNPEYFLLGGWLPAADLESLFDPAVAGSKITGLINPLITLPVEDVFNYDLFLKRKIEEFPGERRMFLQASWRRRLIHYSKIIRLFGEVDALSRGAMSKELEAEEITRMGTIMRALAGLKAYRVNIPTQMRRLKFEQQDIKKRIRSLGKRGDEAGNIPVLRENLEK